MLVTGFDEQRMVYFISIILGRICDDFQASSELHHMKQS